MRFITEFEIVPPAIEARLDAYKSRSEFEMGQLIAQSFDWRNRGFISQSSLAGLRYTLEIEAFPMDKWVEFKKRFADALPDYDPVSRTRLINALAALEEFHGNPSGDAITNLPDRMEYRGPDNHCKACEDEKNVVKHIMAQKHTCNK